MHGQNNIKFVCHFC